MDSYVENILTVYEAADKQDRSDGACWYRQAADWCWERANTYQTTIEVVVAVIAALSPRNKWDRNLADAEAVLDRAQSKAGTDGLKCGTFRKNVDKAYRIATTGNTRILSGIKVQCFFANILDAASRRVTVDVWAARIARGDLHAPPEVISDKDYVEIEAAYQAAAEKVGLHPSALQAITWVTARRYKRLGLTTQQRSLF